MSTPEPAPKQTRQDGARQAAAVAPRSADQSSAGASASLTEANGQAGDAATQRMVADGEANQDPRWKQAMHGVADFAQIMAELTTAVGFSVLTGSYTGPLDLGKALFYMQLVAPKSALAAITLHGATRGSNPCVLTMNVWHKTYGLAAPHLSIAGFHLGSATGLACDLYGLQANGSGMTMGSVAFASATLRDVTFTRGGQTLRAREVGMDGLRVDATHGAALDGALHFEKAHIHDLVYPNATPVSFDLEGGVSLDAVWAKAAPAPATTPTGLPPATTTAATPPAPDGGGGGAAPEPAVDMLPKDAHAYVTVNGVRARAAIGGETSGGVDVGSIALALDDKNKASLASVTITGFHASGTAGAAGGSIDKVVLTGAPNLVDSLLANPAVATDPHVRDAIALVRSVGIKPDISGSVTFTHVGLEHGAAGDQATTDFAANLALPGVGALAVSCTKLSIGTANGAAGSFDHFEATLTDEHGKELGHVDLAGGAAHNASATTRSGAVHSFHARGDVAGIVRAGDAMIQQLPITVRSAFAMVKSLGITGDVSGSLTATATTGGATEIAGSFQARLAAGSVGNVVVDVADFRGSESTAADATFRDFKTTLTNPRGHVVADIHIANGAFVEGAKGAHGAAGATSFKAGAIAAKGDSPSVMAMINAVVHESSTLSPPIRTAFNMVRSYYVNGGGALSMTGVAVGETAGGTQTVQLHSATASFKLGTGESVEASVAGVHGDNAAKGTDVEFDRFSASLAAPTGGGHAKILVERGGAKIGAPPAKTGGAQDFSVHSHHATFDGEAASISKLVAGLRAHLGTLPAPIAQVFDVVGRYATSQTGASQASASITGDNLAVTEAHGQLASQGDVAARVAIPAGVANLALHGFVGDGKDVKFSALDLSVLDPGGGTAASLRVGATHLTATGAITVASVTASGDGARLRSVVDTLGDRVPASITQALAAIGSSRVETAISSISVAPTSDGGLVTDAAVVRVSGAISVMAGGSRYRAPDASLAIYGAHVTLGADKKPREIDATSMDIQGTFSSLGNGRAIDGAATLHAGSSKIVLDAAGKVHEVQTANVVLGGDVSTKTGVAGPSASGPATTPAPAALAGPAPARAQAPASSGPQETETPLAVQAAQAIKSADIHAATPIISGRYGKAVHLDVPAGAQIYTSIQVRDYALTSGTKVQIRPKLESLWIKAGGVDLETSGTQGALKVQLDGMFDINITKYVVGKSKLSLDLGTLVAQVMANLSHTVETAAASAGNQSSAAPAPPPAPTTAAAARSGGSARAKQDPLAKRHDSWAHERKPDLAEEPRSMDVADLFKTGVEPLQTTGTADVEIASRDGQLDAHLRGSAAGNGSGGGTVQLSASDVHAQVAGNTVDATGVDTGAIQVASKDGATNVQLSHFSIETLHWLGS